MQKEKLNISLSFKLFDGVSDASHNGVVFSAFQRDEYIARAFQRLVKILEDLEDDALYSMFKNIHKVSDSEAIDDNNTIDASEYDAIKAIYIERGDALIQEWP